MPTISVEELVRSTPRLYPLPHTLGLLRDLLEDLSMGTSELLPVVQQDPGLTASLLKLCNSSAYGLSRKIGSLNEALVLIGNREFMSLAFSLGVKDMMQGPLPTYRLDADDVWKHSLGVAYGSSYLMRECGEEELQSRAFTAGLLHDVGKILMNAVLSEARDAPIGSAEQRRLVYLERELTGLDHADVGAALLEAWNFPPSMVEAVRHHHHPHRAPSDRMFATIVHAADVVSHELGIGAPTNFGAHAYAMPLLSILGVPMEAVEGLLKTLARKTQALVAAAGA